MQVNGRADHIEDYLCTVRTGQWFGWSDIDNKIYENLIVHDGGSKPTEKECTDGLAAMQAAWDFENANPATLLRKIRNRLLAETDWLIVMHKEKGTNIPTAWKTYRQELRDITNDYTSLNDVVWPEKP